MRENKLSIGMMGDEVGELQSKLILAKLHIPTEELRKKQFGKGTKRALKEWQAAQGLEVTGSVNEITADRLDAFEAPGKQTRLGGSEQKRLQVLNNTLTLTDEQKAQLETRFTENGGDITRLKTSLTADDGFDEDTIKTIAYRFELSELLEDKETLVTALADDPKLNTLRDVARHVRKDDLLNQLSETDIPDDIFGKTIDERKAQYAERLQDRLFHRDPTGVLHRMVEDAEVATDEEEVREGLLTFFDQQSTLDFRKGSVLNIFQQEGSLEAIPEAHREGVIDCLKKMQRLAGICDKAEEVPVLMKAGLDSAYAINEIPQQRFVSLYAARLGGEKVALRTHQNAQNITARNEKVYLSMRQYATGAGVAMIHGANATVAERKAVLAEYVQNKNIPVNIETLFGSADLCECNHCSSVYSPAAYLVELFQYLRNNNLDPDHAATGIEGIHGTSLQNLFRRRPDLGKLDLTCENTNTLIPYIDLVNEVMESFVEHLQDYEADSHVPKQATIDEHNVLDESSGELLAEPQHTNAEAYRTLSKEVYPVCQLPYHQPIDTIRQYLDFLGTSRHELLATFQSPVVHPDGEALGIENATLWETLKKQAVDRAVGAEYLHLTEEEYVILTKEGFHTKEWYELDQEVSLTDEEYRQHIGLQRTWDYYGIPDETQLLDELKWVKPPQETGIIGFLRRTDIEYTELIELLKTRYINPDYLTGKALSYMNSLRFSYRFLQTLVDYEETENLESRYQGLVNFLQEDLANKPASPFTPGYVACWVHRYFEKIGKLIVLEDEHHCQCIRGRIVLKVTYISSSQSGPIYLQIDENCQLVWEHDNESRIVGSLDTRTGIVTIDFEALGIESIDGASFTGLNGETGKLLLPEMILEINGTQMVCTHYHEACDLSKTQFKHLDGTAVITEEYERMHRFIRLWCKLGWEIEEVDQAITGVGEAASHPLPAPSGFFTSAPELHLIPSIDPEPIDDFIPVPIDLSDCQPEPASQVAQEITPYLIEQLVAIKKLLSVTGLKLPGLLTFWTTIGVYGEKSLYQRLFLKYNQKALNNPFLEDEFGVYLSKEGELISTHLPFLMAAFKTDADTIEGVMNLAGIANEMTLENVSAIYRYLQLMKTLGLKLVELRGLIDLTAPLANPFGKPTETQSFYSLFERIENSGFDLRTLNYSILDQDDPRRPLNPGVAHTFRLAMTLREALLKIETDHPDITQVDETTETLLRDKLSLILDSETVENILTLLYGTTTYSDNTRMQFSKNLSPASNEELTEYLQVANNLEADDPQKPAVSFLNRVSFSPVNGLRVTGILNDADQESLTALAGAITHAEDRTNFEVVIEKIRAQPEQLATDLLSEIFTHDPSVKEAILIADAAGDHTEENTAPQKLLAFGVAFLPYLRDQLRKRTVFQTLSGDLGLDTNLTQFLVMDVILSASGDAIYEEIIRLKEQEDAIADEEPEITRKEGFFVPEQDGTYVFLLEATGEATLMLDNQQLWDTHQHTDAEGINYYSSPSLFLTAGKAYPYRLEGYNTDSMGECIGFYLKFENQASVELAPNMLFPKRHTEAFHEAYIRLHQASLVVQGFDVTLPELKFFREHAASLDDLDFNALTFTHWLRLEAFYRLKNSLPETTLSLVNFLRWSHQAELGTEPSLTDQLHALTGWERPAIENLLLPAHLHLDDPEHFRDATNLLTLQHALQVAEKVGVGIGYLFAWGAATSDFDRNRAIAGGIREAIRARYTQEDWETGIKPVHDRLRGNQRDALVAYLLAQPVLRAWGVRDANGLFEFLLIDVEMEPCMETSRIKQAISSVQLYVQRCFLGLEADHGVQSEDLDLERWEWMSRYRVWEANRKVFLYPENWIEPQLRDNKSPFFEELESELLQNDINQDLVKAALTKYMVKVDEVANLEVLGQYLEGDTTSGTLHVVGRTRNAPFFFYYRWYDYATSYWYPWEKVEVDVPSIDVKGEDGRTINNGSYAIPVIWNDRLFIFFPEMMEKNWTSALQKHQTITESAENKSEDIQPLNYWEIKLGWTERKEGKWTPKQLSNRTIETIVVANVENYHIYSEVDKFIFAPFVDDDGVYIRPYYVGATLEVEETLGKGQVLTREITPDTDPTTLIHSFKFESDKVRVTSTIAYGLVPAHWSNTYAFHTSAGSLEPIQGEGIENYPVSMVEPSFSDLGGQVTFKSGSADYNFHHPTTRKLLGYLRKDRMEQVIKELGENSDDNYGSNGGTSYHELARPFALYNWEFQFHAIATLADQLAKSQRFEESMQWWHYIFNPIAVQGDIRYAWRFFPFWAADSQNVLDQLFDNLDPNAPDQEVTEWREAPFMPHVIARSRPTSYMKWVVMKYIDNLIAWGDHLFRQDSIESINQATQVYVLASHILGPKPEIIPKRGKVQPKSYLDLVDQWDAFSNAMVDLELLFPFSNQINTEGVLNDEGEPHYVNIYGFATTLYFCIPDNPKLLGYWDTVADRLFKIRHCLNIEGVFRKLSLFQPPIDPALLVKAAAQGLSIGSVLSDLSTPLPNYRFHGLLSLAQGVVAEVKSLGGALLSALEKKDGEALSLLRARHETNIQQRVMEVRKLQLDEAEKSLESLRENRKSPEYRLRHYQELAGEEVSIPSTGTEFTELQNELPEVKEESGMKLIASEKEDLDKASEARDYQIAIGVIESLASVLHALPFVAASVKPLGVGVGVGYGGSNFGNVTQALARALRTKADDLSYQSGRAGKTTSFLRQHQDRIFQANLAGYELMQIDRQITTQEIRKEMAQLEIDNQQVQMEQSQEAETFLRTKFSNEQLYQWMSDQLSGLYHEAYQLAYDLAKKAEKAYRFDHGLATTDFIKFGYWDSSKEGFLAGEKLHQDLVRLQNAHIENKPHDYEVTKHISLQQLNPLALIMLKEQGVCEFELPETLFDLDYAGHFMRRIKTVSISVPCIAGPYTSLNCTLRLLNHEFRNSKVVAGAADYAKNLEESDERFVYNPIATTSIAVSQGQNDSGTFELTFNGERYLPFEGAGAISRWRLELPDAFRQFDYDTISDVIMHLSYTSCEGGQTLKSAAQEHLETYVSDAEELSQEQGLFRMFSLKHEFPNEWHRLLQERDEEAPYLFRLGNLEERLPFFANSKQVSALTVDSFRLFSGAGDVSVNFRRADAPEQLDEAGNLLPAPISNGIATGGLTQYVASDLGESLSGYWGLEIDVDDPGTLENAWLVMRYQIEIAS